MKALELKKKFGAVVKSERDRLGISQETLAERADLHRTYITDIERGARNPSFDTIHKLAGALEISLGSLFARIEAEWEEGGARRAAPVGEAMDLLLVEDNPHDVELTLAGFREARLTNTVHVVRDGEAALDFVFCRRKYAGRRLEPLPRVMLLDLNLPKVGGIEVLRRVKEDERARSIHVVVLTMSKREEHRREAFELGAEAYIVKPVGFQNLSEVTPKFNFGWALVAGIPHRERMSAAGNL